jgi:small subunit ribosomal protein S15
MTAIDKQKIIEEMKQSENDTGSPEVVISILTHRIKSLTDHLKSNKQDFHSRYGMMKLISKRKRLLKYLKSKSTERYAALIKLLGLRR